MRKGGKKNKWNKVLPIFIVLVMVGSMFMVFTGTGQSKSYNGYKFREVQTGWATKINGQEIIFAYHPEQTEDIESADIGEISGKNVIITYDSTHANQGSIDTARFELTNLMRDHMYVQSSNIPDLDCETQNKTTIGIYMSNETKITKQGDCIKLEAAYATDIFRVTNRFEYQLLGIIG